MNRCIEPLESRQLLAGGPEVTAFRIVPRSPERGTGSMVFIVTLRDTDGVDPTSFDVRDLRIAGPNNFARYARAYASQSNELGTERIVRYKMGPPGVAWTEADNGRYTVRLHGNSVFDNLGNPADSQHLGVFNANISNVLRVEHVARDVSQASSLAETARPTFADARLIEELV